jgi:hypothetical protein
MVMKTSRTRSSAFGVTVRFANGSTATERMRLKSMFGSWKVTFPWLCVAHPGRSPAQAATSARSDAPRKRFVVIPRRVPMFPLRTRCASSR